MASIKAKKELEAKQKAVTKTVVKFPTEAFSENDMLLQWTKYAQKLEDRGQMILNSLMMISTPKLQGFTIVHDLPNEGTKIEFERAKNEILGYLRGMLHNHDIEIEVIVNEKIETKKAFTPEEKYNRLKELNPHLELLRKTFDLDI